jgi:hypothetical protein
MVLGQTMNVGLRARLLGVMFLMLATSAFADTQVSDCGRYSIWLPNNWKVTINKDRLTAISGDDEIWLVVAPLSDKDADLLDEDVTNFVKEEIENVKFTSDRRDKLSNFQVRILEGTDDDEGKKVFFKALALDPGGNEAVIELLVYADRTEMNRPANKNVIDRILRSLMPTVSAFADTQVNACGSYSISVPSNWKITIDNERLSAVSRDSQLSLVVAPLSDEARLLDTHEHVSNFIEEEIGKVKFTSDRREKLGDFQVRVLEGAGEGDQLFFKVLALDPGRNKAVIELLIYADRAEMNSPANKTVIDQILRSFKPS